MSFDLAQFQQPRFCPVSWNLGSWALLIVDMQNGTCGDDQIRIRPEFYQNFRRNTLPASMQALETARRYGLEIIHTVISNLTLDGRDRCLDYKRCGLGFPLGSHAAKVIKELAPLEDELILPKSSSSPFTSTTLDYLLRNMQISTLIIMGLLTDQCIDHTVKDAADRGYQVVCLVDACQSESLELHQHALSCFQGYAALLSVEDFTDLLSFAQ